MNSPGRLLLISDTRFRSCQKDIKKCTITVRTQPAIKISLAVLELLQLVDKKDKEFGVAGFELFFAQAGTEDSV